MSLPELVRSFALAFADASINTGAVSMAALNGQEVPRRLYTELKKLNLFDKTATDKDKLDPRVKADFSFALLAFYKEILASPFRYINQNQLNRKTSRSGLRALTAELGEFAKQEADYFPRIPTLGLLEEILQDFSARPKAKQLPSGKELVEENILDILEFNPASESPSGDLARRFMRSAYHRIFIRTLVIDCLKNIGLNLNPTVTELFLPKISVYSKDDVWEVVDKSIRPKIACLQRLLDLAEKVKKSRADVISIIEEFLKSDKTQLPSWFLKRHELVASLPISEKQAEIAGQTQSKDRVSPDRSQSEILLAHLETKTDFNDLSDSQKKRVLRVLSPFQISVSRELIDSLFNGSFKMGDLDSKIREAGANYTAIGNASASEPATNAPLAPTQLKIVPLTVDYTLLDAKAGKYPEKLRAQLERFFKEKALSTIPELLKSGSIGSIVDSKAFEFKQETWRLYFTIEEGRHIQFVLISHKNSQTKDASFLRSKYPK